MHVMNIAEAHVNIAVQICDRLATHVPQLEHLACGCGNFALFLLTAHARSQHWLASLMQALTQGLLAIVVNLASDDET